MRPKYLIKNIGIYLAISASAMPMNVCTDYQTVSVDANISLPGDLWLLVQDAYDLYSDLLLLAWFICLLDTVPKHLEIF